MVKNIGIIEKMLGSKTKKVTRSKKNIKIVRKSLVALKINRNEKFSKFNITCKDQELD